MFGVASAPAMWQREIKKCLIGIPGVTVGVSRLGLDQFL